MKSRQEKFCYLAYLVSLIVFIFLAVKVVDVRSRCTREKARISKLVSEIKSLKDENNRLIVEFYREVRPKVVDEETKDMKILHENEVKYLK